MTTEEVWVGHNDEQTRVAAECNGCGKLVSSPGGTAMWWIDDRLYCQRCINLTAWRGDMRRRFYGHVLDPCRLNMTEDERTAVWKVARDVKTPHAWVTIERRNLGVLGVIFTKQCNGCGASRLLHVPLGRNEFLTSEMTKIVSYPDLLYEYCLRGSDAPMEPTGV